MYLFYETSYFVYDFMELIPQETQYFSCAMDSHHQLQVAIASWILISLKHLIATVHSKLVLLLKLAHYGIQHAINTHYQWIPIWLTTRTQRVTVAS